MHGQIDNHFHRVLVAAARARELHRKNVNSGTQPYRKELIDALREVDQGKITYEDVRGLK